MPCFLAIVVGALCLSVTDRTVAGAERRRSGTTAAEGETAGRADGTKGVGAVVIRSSGPLARFGDADEPSVGAASQFAAARLVEQVEAVVLVVVAVVVDPGAAEAGGQTAAVDKESLAARCLATTGFAPAVLLAAVGTGSKFVVCLVGVDHLGRAAERLGEEGLAQFVG